ncbi:hypothetical protein C8R47DRAFT_1205945 [Mycena vitilis]|nr:hypothetical protein C8R47DRAFT_1205945 [Mycena vitilis]
MHAKILTTLIVSCLYLFAAAAPLADAVHNVARSPAPVEIKRTPEPEPEPGCKIYGCIWCARLFFARSTLSVLPPQNT